jgi:DNA-binding MarR family transcriptional regulator
VPLPRTEKEAFDIEQPNEKMRELERQLMHAMFRFKKAGTPFPPHGRTPRLKSLGISGPEIFILKSIEHNMRGSDENTCMGDIREHMFVTKAAVSQMLGSLESKGYVNREIDAGNRRKIVLTLTEKGVEAVRGMEKKFDAFLLKIIQRFGEENTRQLISLFGGFADVMEEVKAEFLKDLAEDEDSATCPEGKDTHA